MAILLVGFITALIATAGTLIAGHGWLWAILAYVVGGMAGTLFTGLWIFAFAGRKPKPRPVEGIQAENDRPA